MTQKTAGTLCGYAWTFTGGSSGTSSSTGMINVSPMVAPGDTLQLTVTDTSTASLTYNPACDTALVTLQISGTTPAPAPTLTSPPNGST